MSNPLRIACRLFEELERCDVRHCHWKSNQHLVEGLAGLTDLDLLVDKSQATCCEVILSSLAYKRCYSQPWARYPGIEDWLGFDEETGKLVHIHLHYKLLSGQKFVKEQHLPWENLILRTAIKDPKVNVYVTDPNLEMNLLLIRIALKTTFGQLFGALRGRDLLPKNVVDEYDYLYEHSDQTAVHQYATELLGGEFAEQVLTIVNQNAVQHPSTIWRLKSLVLKTLRQKARYGRTQSMGIFLLNFLRSRFSRAQRKVGMFGQLGKHLHSGGAIVAVIGSDGAGKSTVSKELRKWLSWKVDVQEMYLGTGDGIVGLPIKGLQFLSALGNRKPRKAGVATTEPKPNKQKRSYLRELGAGVLGWSIAQERYEKTLQANHARLQGGIVITDRFPQNQFMSIYDGPRINGGQVAGSSFMHFFAKRELEIYDNIAEVAPDLVFKLHVPPEVAWSRKPDHPIDNIQKKAEITCQLCFPGSKVIDIDASQPLEDVLLSVKRHVWKFL